MGINQRPEKMESVRPAGKNPRGPLVTLTEVLTSVLVVVAILHGTSCSNNPVRSHENWTMPAGVAKTSPLHTEPEFWKKAVTQIGQNDAAVFSADGKRILYISRERLNHRHRQLYEMDLINRTEKRLTFQDGEVMEALFSPFDGHIFYTSTTDEIKEHPKLFYPDLDKSPFPRTEVYRIKAEGDLHERWTENVGFDGFMHIHDDNGKSKVMTISRYVNGDLQLMRSPLGSSKFEVALAKPATWLHSFTSHPMKSARAWIEETTTGRSSKLVISGRGAQPKSLVTRFFEVRNLHFWDGKEERGLSSAKENVDNLKILLTAKLRTEGPRQALWVDPANNCYHTLDLGPGEINSLDVSSDQQKILWTLSQGNISQIFVDDLKKPDGICEAL